MHVFLCKWAFIFQWFGLLHQWEISFLSLKPLNLLLLLCLLKALEAFGVSTICLPERYLFLYIEALTLGNCSNVNSFPLSYSWQESKVPRSGNWHFLEATWPNFLIGPPTLGVTTNLAMVTWIINKEPWFFLWWL